MKILEINKFHYIKGGSERYYFDIAEVLRQHGHEVVNFSMKNPNNIPCPQSVYFIDEVSLDKFNLKNILKHFYNYDAVRKLKKLIKAEKPDIAHLHNINHQLTPAIIKILKDNKIPVVQTLHDYKLICPNTRLYTNNANCERCRRGKYYNCFLNKCMHDSYLKSFLGMLEMYLNKTILKYYDMADLYIAPSRYLEEACVRFGVPAEKIIVINNFIDQPEREISGETGDYLLYFGRLTAEKGIDTLIRAIAECKNAQKLKIAGEGDQMYELIALARDLGVEDRIEFVGFKRGVELDEVVGKARAIVLPSLWPENMPYSLLEAMALGKVVIVARAGGMPEMIEDGKNGFVFPAGDDKALGEIIDNLDQYNMEAIGQAAREKLKSVNSEAHYQTIKAAFNRLTRVP